MERLDVMLEPLRASLALAGAYLPRLAVALVVVAVGWFAAKLVRFAVERALRAVNFNVLGERAGVDGFLRGSGLAADTVALFGLLAYWLVILATLIIAFNGLGLTYITDLLREIVRFAPHVIIALLALVLGAYFARYVGSSVAGYCRSAGLQDAAVLGHLAQSAVLAFVVLIALDQLGVGAIVRASFLIVLGGVVFALALAFGIGGRRRAAALLERWWPTRRGPGPAVRTGTDDARGAPR
jgi:hypothetical protein